MCKVNNNNKISCFVVIFLNNYVLDMNNHCLRHIEVIPFFPIYSCWVILYLGIREAEINVAEGKKQSRILNSEANKTEQINMAVGTQ